VIRRLILIFILFSPFSAWLAVDKWLRLPVVILLVIVAVSIFVLLIEFYRNPKAFFQDQEDYLLVFFLLFVWVAFFYGFFNTRSFNHSMSYTFSITCYFLAIKFLIKRQNIELDDLAKYAMYSVVLCNVIIVVEWLLYNLMDIPIRDYFLTGGPGTSNMDYYYQTFFFSVAGPGEEPGGTASLINILFPIGIWHLSNQQQPIKILIYILLHIVGTIFLASAASIVFLLIAFFVSGILYRFSNIYKYLLYLIVVIYAFWCVYQFDLFGWGTFIERYANYVTEKISLSDTNYSAFDRKLKWQYAIEDWQSSPWIGNGPGHGTEAHSTGYFNTFLSILADTGIFSFLFFTFFFVIIFIKINTLTENENFFFMVSFVCLLLHSSIYYVYYHEPFWFLIILVQLLYKRNWDKMKLQNV